MTSILLSQKNKAGYKYSAALKGFYTSRFKRIVPAYFFMLVVVALVAAVFFLPQDFNTFKKGLEQAAWFNSSNYFADFGDYFAPANHEQPLLHTWSLAVEIQFYLLAPIFILFLPVHLLKWVFVTLLIGLTFLAEYRLRQLGIEQATYYSFYARLPEFFAGGLAALYTASVSGRGRKSAWFGNLGLALIILAAIAQPLLGPFPGIAALLPVAGSALLLSHSAHGLAGKQLSSKFLVWVGALSYSLYLWHWPVLAFLRYYTGAEVLSIEFSLLFILLTLMLSIASYYGVERAFRSKHTSKKQAIGWTLLIVSVFGTSQAMAKVNAAFTPEELPIEYRRYADPATICHGQIVGDCLRGDLTSDREILILGDSHAAMLNHFFDYLGKELGFKARIITASSCVTILGFDYQRLADWGHKPCVDQISYAQLHIDNAELIVIGGMWSYQTASNDFLKAFERYLQVTAVHDKKVFILSQIPLFKQDTMQVKRFANIGLTGSLALDKSYLEANLKLEKITRNYSHVTYIAQDELAFFSKVPF